MRLAALVKNSCCFDGLQNLDFLPPGKKKQKTKKHFLPPGLKKKQQQKNKKQKNKTKQNKKSRKTNHVKLILISRAPRWRLKTRQCHRETLSWRLRTSRSKMNCRTPERITQRCRWTWMKSEIITINWTSLLQRWDIDARWVAYGMN